MTPCADQANDPEDWFIERDGRQYADEQVVTDAQVGERMQQAYLEDRTCGEDEMRAELEAEATKAALVRRRHAKDKCYTCYGRIACLSLALADEPPRHGIWGGYYGEELKLIRDERDRRAALRLSEVQQVDQE